jgi:carbamoyl-phosphate synthase large subunit
VVYVLEVNPRASRTVPFVSKATGIPLARLATRVMLGEKVSDLGVVEAPLVAHAGRPVAVKEAVLPFLKFAGVDPILGPEMRSTGEVMGIDPDLDAAFAKSQLGAGTTLPVAGTLFVSVADVDKEGVLPAVARLSQQGFRILATSGTHRFLVGAGVACERVSKVREGSPHILDEILNGRVQVIFNTTVGAKAVEDSKALRVAAIQNRVSYFTSVAACDAASRAILRIATGVPREVASLQENLARAGGPPPA